MMKSGKKVKNHLGTLISLINVDFSNEINKRGGEIFFCGGWNFSKSVSVDSTFIRKMRVKMYSSVPNNRLSLISVQQVKLVQK